MKTTILLIALASNVALAAGLKNFHALSSKVYRSAAPTTAAAGFLAQQGFTDVVIFKNETRHEVASEIQSLRVAGLNPAQIHHIPFRWDDEVPFGQACKQVLQALRILVAVEQSDQRRVLFHCSLGEDRTGLLAGLYRMLTQNWPVQKTFRQEMCAFGYEAGDTNKPPHVVNTIRSRLTPTFLKMAYLIQQKSLTPGRLDESICMSRLLQDAEVESWLRDRGHFICAP